LTAPEQVQISELRTDLRALTGKVDSLRDDSVRADEARRVQAGNTAELRVELRDHAKNTDEQFQRIDDRLDALAVRTDKQFEQLAQKIDSRRWTLKEVVAAAVALPPVIGAFTYLIYAINNYNGQPSPPAHMLPPPAPPSEAVTTGP
jgi:hypothetical protein